MTDAYYDESRELIEMDDHDNETKYLRYCFCTKSLYEMRECSCRYCLIGSCALPLLIVGDVISLVPQIIINNVKLCLH